VGQSKGGLPPDSVVQKRKPDTGGFERLIRQYHDPAPGAMVRIALGAVLPPFSVSPELMRATAALAGRYDVSPAYSSGPRLATKRAYCLNRFGKRPLDLLEDVGWLNANTWLAHGIWFNRGEVTRLGRAGVGIAHCPTSNMRLGSGSAPVLALRRAGCPVGWAWMAALPMIVLTCWPKPARPYCCTA